MTIDWRMWELIAPEHHPVLSGGEPDLDAHKVIHIKFRGKEVKIPLPKGASVEVSSDSDIEKLSEKHGGYWGEHLLYPLSDWQLHVQNNETRLGYWEYVEAQLEGRKIVKW